MTTCAGQTGDRKTCGVEHARAPYKAIRDCLCSVSCCGLVTMFFTANAAAVIVAAVVVA